MKNKQHLRHCVTVLCSCGIMVLWACSGLAWGYQIETINGYPIRWPTPSAGFYINTSGGPAGSLTAIQAALQTWTDVSTSNFSFTYQGATPSTNAGSNNNTNIVCFGALGAGFEDTLALNTFWFYSTGILSDSDIKFNTSFDWATNLSSNAFDIQTIALHELGHALSLSDLYGGGDTAKVMYGYYSEGQIKRSLTQDDRAGITYLYPGGGATTTSSAPVTTTTTTLPATTTTTAPSGTTTSSMYTPDEQCPAMYALGQDHPYLEQLRAFRNGPLARSTAGRRIIQLYYDHADSITAALERSPALRAAARGFFEAAALLMADKK